MKARKPAKKLHKRGNHSNMPPRACSERSQISCKWIASSSPSSETNNLSSLASVRQHPLQMAPSPSTFLRYSQNFKAVSITSSSLLRWAIKDSSIPKRLSRSRRQRQNRHQRLLRSTMIMSLLFRQVRLMLERSCLFPFPQRACCHISRWDTTTRQPRPMRPP